MFCPLPTKRKDPENMYMDNSSYASQAELATLPPPPAVSVWKVDADTFEVYHGGANPHFSEPLATLHVVAAPSVDTTLLAKGLLEAAYQIEEFAKLAAHFGGGSQC